MPNPKHLRAKAERAAVWYCREVLGCVAHRKAVRTKWQAVDFFGADIVAKDEEGIHFYIQVTTGSHSSVTKRRRKLESVPWHPTDRVMLLQLVQLPDPANAKRKKQYFRIHNLVRTSENPVLRKHWITDSRAFEIPRNWFTAWKQENISSGDRN